MADRHMSVGGVSFGGTEIPGAKSMSIRPQATVRRLFDDNEIAVTKVIILDLYHEIEFMAVDVDALSAILPGTTGTLTAFVYGKPIAGSTPAHVTLTVPARDCVLLPTKNTQSSQGAIASSRLRFAVTGTSMTFA